MEKKILDNLTIVIPIHNFGEGDKELFEKAIQSINENESYQPKEILIVHSKPFNEYGIDTNFKCRLLHNTTDKTDFQAQINYAAKHVETEYFSILEFDDEYGSIAYSNFKEYSDYYKEVSIFIPIIVDVDMEGNFIKFSGTEGLSRGLVSEGQIGLLTHQTLQHIQSITTSGAYYKTEDFNLIGGLKSNVKLSFMYEYFLRASHNDQKILVIPKMSYLHRNGRQGSFLEEINNSGLTAEDIKFWFETAQKEFYFTKDREIKYTT